MSYTDHFGLNAAPFALTPDPRFWFESATHKKAMAYLGYGLQQAEGFVVVTGEIGAGKTTLVGLLMERLDPARVATVKLVSTQVEGDDVLRLAAQGFALPTEGVAKAQLLDRIERYLIDRAREGRKTLLIVDEAQNLPVSALEELRMLSNFQSRGQALLQILLLGQPEFRERLASPALQQLRQRVIATHHLDGMGVDEVLPYLEHRLGVAGWTGKPTFDTAAAYALHAASDGVPRRINQLATRTMLLAALEATDTIDATLVGKVVVDLGMDQKAVEPVEVPVTFPAPGLRQEQPHYDYAARLDLLERQIEAQEAALRRVLTLMIDWVERDDDADDADFARARPA
jgi:putative secretion ATPase (PEP-CTERM system associated)